MRRLFSAFFCAAIFFALSPSAVCAPEIYFSPKGGCTDAIVREFGRAKKSIHFQAYSFTSKPIVAALITAKNRGVEIEGILDAGWRNQAAKTKTVTAEPALLAANIRVLIDALHAIAHNKVAVVDGVDVVTGSLNWTGQAETSNAENVVLIRNSPKIAAKFEANYQVHAGHSTPALSTPVKLNQSISAP